MTPYWSDETVALHLGDCIEVLAALEPASVDSIVTDPPYGLEFMGVAWDTMRDDGKARARNEWGDFGSREHARHPSEIAGIQRKKNVSFYEFSLRWAAECFRVLKPGAHLLAFGGTRTYHRLACGIEDAGLEVRDCIDWLYATGFPKSHNLGDGRGTALKPAHEPIIVARKPLTGPVAANVLEYGTGALNIADCRVGTERRTNSAGGASSLQRVSSVEHGYRQNVTASEGQASEVTGRWPANIVLTHAAACREVGTRVVRNPSGSVKGTEPSAVTDAVYAARERVPYVARAAETITAWECAAGCPVAELDQQSGVSVSRSGGVSTRALGIMNDDAWKPADMPRTGHADAGGASRFFPAFRYEAKAAASERPRGEDGTAHPTVKPVDLMAWLVRLVTPPGGLVLDPFGGSGTTAEACIVEGFRCVLIEKDPAYAELIRTRLRKDIQPSMFGGVA